MKNLPVPIYKDKKITVSADGSIMFYSMSYGEAYRAKSIGAFTESYHKFFKAGKVAEKYEKHDVRILDLCFGLGYNCAVTFEYLYRIRNKNIAHIVSVEKDYHLLQLVCNLNCMWPTKGYSIVKECLGFKNRSCDSDKFSMEMYVMDSLDIINSLSGIFDVIYFDPFSISKNPDMWSVAVFKKMYSLMGDDSCLVTYACGKKARNNMIEAGFIVDDVLTARGAFHPGTYCKKN